MVAPTFTRMYAQADGEATGAQPRTVSCIPQQETSWPDAGPSHKAYTMGAHHIGGSPRIYCAPCRASINLLPHDYESRL